MRHTAQSYNAIEVLAAIVVGAAFVGSAYFSMQYEDQLTTFVSEKSAWGALSYVVLACVATVIAPISAAPLIPVATTIWGPFMAAVLSIAGWMLGAIVAFALARRFGYHFVSRLVAVHRLQRYANQLPQRHMFWSVVFLRLILPVDVLSYALGLVTTMPLRKYMLATVLGITPFAFVFSYTATAPPVIQVLILILIGIVLLGAYRYLQLLMRGNKKELILRMNKGVTIVAV